LQKGAARERAAPCVGGADLVQKTNRIAVIEEGPLTGGWASDVLALVTEHALGDLDDGHVYTRDAAITLPWLSGRFLRGAMRHPVRRGEPEVLAFALGTRAGGDPHAAGGFPQRRHGWPALHDATALLLAPRSRRSLQVVYRADPRGEGSRPSRLRYSVNERVPLTDAP
jgi:hypothetical protein